eukprot:gene3680-4103_t
MPHPCHAPSHDMADANHAAAGTPQQVTLPATFRYHHQVALKIAKDPRFERLVCDNKYADDCIVDTVKGAPIYIVATQRLGVQGQAAYLAPPRPALPWDKALKKRVREVPGVPIMYIKQHRYTIERMPEADMAPRE